MATEYLLSSPVTFFAQKTRYFCIFAWLQVSLRAGSGCFNYEYITHAVRKPHFPPHAIAHEHLSPGIQVNFMHAASPFPHRRNVAQIVKSGEKKYQEKNPGIIHELVCPSCALDGLPQTWLFVQHMHIIYPSRRCVALCCKGHYQVAIGW